jgi:hypothetical protein
LVKNFLGLFQRFWRLIFPKPEPSPVVCSDERLSRYIFFGSHLKLKQGFVSPEVFTPPNNRTLSIYRTDNCSEQNIWELADIYVTPHRPDHRVSKGRADMKAEVAFEQQLQVIPYPKPHPRHANIVGWPDEPGGALELLKARELANRAIRVLRPDPIT